MDFGAVNGSYAGGLSHVGAAQYEGQTAAAEYGDPAAQAALIKQLDKFDKQLGKWSEWRTDAKEARDVTKGDQWPQAAIDALEDDDETASPAVFNYVDPMVSAISGAEITNRQQVKYAPRKVGALAANELISGAADWARDECDAGDEESQAFRDVVITGLGCTETRMDYDDDLEGVMRVDRIDCVRDKVSIDTNARKPNYVDAKFVRRTRRYDDDEAKLLFADLMSTASYGVADDDLSPHLNDPTTRYDPDRSNAKGEDCPQGMVDICEYQWFDLVRVLLVVDPATRQVLQLDPAQQAKMEAAGINLQTMTQSASVRRKRWRRCFRNGNRTRCADLPDGEFTYKFITGKIDDETGMPYGVVAAMIDPQRWSNKFLLQMDRIFGSNAKGGVFMEEDAVEDQDAFETSFAKHNKVTWVADGALAAGKIQPKTGVAFPTIADRLLQIATNAVAAVTGVNKEMLGLAERDQPIGLEYQRKQAAYGVLAIFFDSLKRYRKLQGRLGLKYIQKYMSDGRLVRIGGEGEAQYVPLVRDPNVVKYDVIVDEAPAGPNQIERTWATFVQGAPLIQSLIGAGVAMPVIFTILKYSPMPSSFLTDLQQSYAQAQQQQQQQNPMQQLQMMLAQANVAKTQGQAQKEQAQAAAAMAEAQTAPQRTQAEMMSAVSDAQLKQAQAQAAWILTQLQPQKHQADIGLTQARTHDINVDAHLKPSKLILDARDQQMNWDQAVMSHEAHVNDMAHRHARENSLGFDGPGFGGKVR